MPNRLSETQSVPEHSGRSSTAERILDAAEDCFARKGFEGTRLRDVAEIVGIRIPSLYNHFDGKQSLYAAVLERGITPILELLARSITGREESHSDPAAIIGEVMTLLGERPNLPRLVQYEILAGGDPLAFTLDGWVRPTLERSLELLRGTPAADQWEPDQLPYLLLALLNMILGHFAMTPLIDQLLGEDPNSSESIARATEVYGQVATLLTLRSNVAAPTSASHS